MTFYTSLSGLQAAQTSMSTISNNLANVGTDGFKKSTSDFADVMASNFYTAPSQQIGMGTTLTRNVQQFGEGNLKTTGGALDLAISGDGFFAVQQPGASAGVAYTRNGGFTVDSNHNIVDAQGSALLAYPVDASGNVTASGADGLAKVTIPTTSGTPTATSKVTLDVNLANGATTPTAAFDRNNPATYTNSAQTTIYDANGNAQTLTNYFVRDSAADTTGSTGWSVYSYVGDRQLTTGGSTAPTAVSFDATGAMTSPTAATTFDAFTSPATGQSQTLSLDLAGSTQKASAFSVAARSQDGSSVGQFSGVSVDTAGIITATFSNGDSRALGKVAVANFTNPTGLRQLGGSYWSATGVSGAASLGAAGDNGYGSLMSGTIEGSNVDITSELVDLIAAQRNFQANSKALDTQSQLVQTIFQIQS